jgi:hypothetical protein
VRLNGKAVLIKIFVMTLGYSRAQYVEFVMDEKLETLMTCHENAFHWFGGIPEEILYDNPKTIILDRLDGQLHFNTGFEDFIRAYGVTPRLCRPRRAQTKGKVESGVKFIKKSFLPGTQFRNLEEANAKVWAWIREYADERIHGTTFVRPSERFIEEKAHLTSLPLYRPYTPQETIERRVARDCFVNYQTNRYSVPWQYVGKKVEVKKAENKLRFYYGDDCISEHPVSETRHHISEQKAHFVGINTVSQSRFLPLRADGNEVQIRPLDVYVALAGVATPDDTTLSSGGGLL